MFLVLFPTKRSREGVRTTNNGTYESTFPMKLLRKSFMPSNVINVQTIPDWYWCSRKPPAKTGQPPC